MRPPTGHFSIMSFSSICCYLVSVLLLPLILLGCGGPKGSERPQDSGTGVQSQGPTASTFFRQAEAYRKKNNTEGAIHAYNQAIRLDPQYAAAYRNRGLVYFELGEPKRALEDYTEAIRLNAQDADAYLFRGRAYAELNQLLKAVADYDQVIRLNPQFALAYYARGSAYRQLGQRERAREDWNRGIQLDIDQAANLGLNPDLIEFLESQRR